VESKDRVPLMSVCIYFNDIVYICLYVSSPYLLVFADNPVMSYTRVDDIISGTSEA